MSHIELSENPEFNIQMRKLEETDPAAAELFNAMFKQLLENEASIINGTVKVGDAEKLNGNDSTVFAKATELAKYALVASLDLYAKLTDLAAYAKVTDLAPYAKTTDLAKYLPLTGGNLTGNLTISNNRILHAGISRPVIISSTAPSDTTALWVQ